MSISEMRLKDFKESLKRPSKSLLKFDQRGILT